jgi:hypothetical protein
VMTKSAMETRPSGRSTRSISARARLFRVERLRTPLETIASTEASGRAHHLPHYT